MASKMFSFITKTWNPLGGKCLHACSYCWARKLAERYRQNKYQGKPRLFPKSFECNFKASDFVFACDMTDLFGYWVPAEMIRAILLYIQKSPATFLLLTKNPVRYSEFDIPRNCVCGATIESDIEYNLIGPLKSLRLEAMKKLKHPRKMISVEPVMAFSANFTSQLIEVKPEFVVVGYDNYGCGLVEPPFWKVKALIDHLEVNGIKVYRKTLREAWNAL